MPFQSVDNTAEFTALFRLANGKRAQFSLYGNNDAGAWDATQLGAGADAMSDAIVANYVPALSIDHAFLGVVARDLEQRFGRVEERILAAPQAGTLNSPSLPAQVCVVTTFKSATGEPRTGRAYLMSPTEGQVVGSALSAGAQATLEAAMEAVAGSIDDLPNVAHVIVSRFDGTETYTKTSPSGHALTLERPKKRPSGIVANVAAVVVETGLATQRKRLLRAGA